MPVVLKQHLVVSTPVCKSNPFGFEFLFIFQKMSHWFTFWLHVRITMFCWLYSHYEANSVSGAWYKFIYGDVPFKFVAGLIVILSLQFFTPYFYYIPKASLAAVIIAAVVFMVEFHVVKPMWRTKSKSFCNFLYCSTGVILNVSHMHYRCSSCKLPLETMFMYFMCSQGWLWTAFQKIH